MTISWPETLNTFNIFNGYQPCMLDLMIKSWTSSCDHKMVHRQPTSIQPNLSTENMSPYVLKNWKSISRYKFNLVFYLWYIRTLSLVVHFTFSTTTKMYLNYRWGNLCLFFSGIPVKAYRANYLIATKARRAFDVIQVLSFHKAAL